MFIAAGNPYSSHTIKKIHMNDTMTKCGSVAKFSFSYFENSPLEIQIYKINGNFYRSP